MLTGLVGDVSIPKRTGTATAYWFGADNAYALTESTGTIGTISMSPKTVGAYSKFSRLMELQSTPDIEQLIRADFVALLADAIDTLPSMVLAAAANPPASCKRQELVRLREEPTVWPQPWTICWI